MERHLSRLRGSAAEEPERHEHGERRRLAERLGGALEHRTEVERARLLDEDEEASAKVASPNAFMMNAFLPAATACTGGASG